MCERVSPVNGCNAIFRDPFESDLFLLIIFLNNYISCSINPKMATSSESKARTFTMLIILLKNEVCYVLCNISKVSIGSRSGLLPAIS